MAKKHWIYIKRGLSEDAKHRAQMGECVWLYMHIIDRADWETGIAYDWKDAQEAADMSLPLETLRKQRQKLEKYDYIRCEQNQHSQDVRIMEWRNPRDYGTEVKNPRIEGGGEPQPSEIQGGSQGRRQGQGSIGTPPLDSDSKSFWKPDLVDGILEYTLKPKAIRDALAKYFQLTPNFETKYNRQWMQWAIENNVTEVQIERAADLYRRDKRFNWRQPELKIIQEHWIALTEETSSPESDSPAYQPYVAPPENPNAMSYAEWQKSKETK